MREPLRRTPEEEAEDVLFFRRYGPWEPLDPTGLAEFMAGSRSGPRTAATST